MNIKKAISSFIIASMLVTSFYATALADEEQTNTEVTETNTETNTETSINSAKNADEFIEEVSNLADDNRIVVNTIDDLSGKIENASGVNYDGTYVISFADKDSLNKAVKYLDSKDIGYALDGTVSICSTGTEILETSVKANASTRVAVIDTGSNIANESYSVIDDSDRDYNGHGTKVVSNILSYTDDAYIISIKAINSNGRGTMTDVCAALNFAINSDVDVIVMCISIYDTGDYDGFKELIAEADKKGVTVIASAGNNNSDAKKYTPGNIDKVITVGALNEDLTKAASSNYGSKVDYYVVSKSTSDAASIFAGKYISENMDEVYTTYKSEEDLEITEPEETVEPEEPKFDINDGWHNYSSSIPDGQLTWLPEEELRSIGYKNDSEFRAAVIEACKSMLGGAYGSSINGWDNEHTDCITMTTRAYAQALGLISDLHTTEGCVHGLHVEYTSTPGALDTINFGPTGGYTLKQASERYGISVENGQDAVYLFVERQTCTFTREIEPIRVEKTLTETLEKLNAREGDIVLWAKLNSKGQYSWQHANVYSGDSNWFYDSYQSASPIEYRQRSNTPYPIGSNSWSAIAVIHIPTFGTEEETPTPTPVPASTLLKVDGVYQYYKDGEFCPETTLVKYNGQYWYVKDGILDKSETLVKYNNSWWYVNNGKLDKTETLVKYNNSWWYVKDGKLNKAETLVKYNNAWWYVKDTRLCRDTAFVSYNVSLWYCKDGRLQRTYSGDVTIGEVTKTVLNGKVVANIE